MVHLRERQILDAARAGDASGIGDLLETYRPRLDRMVSLRMDPRLTGRFDPADVLQETFVEVSERLEQYLAREDMPFFLWVRFLVGQKLLQLHRRHIGAERRAADREVSMTRPATPEASAILVASQFLSISATPSQAAVREEEHERVRRALEAMPEIDREVLVLRHFEQLTNGEVARLLELTPQAASARYVRALTRLQSVVGGTG